MHPISTVEKATGDTEYPSAAALSQTLLDAIPHDKRNQDAYQVLAYLADANIKHGSDNSFSRVTTKAIHTDLGGNPNREPATWLNPIWKTVCDRAFPEIQPTLIRRCREQGWGHYPKICKASGNPARYYLEAEPLPAQPAEALTFPTVEDVYPEILTYEPDLTLQLSRRGKFLFEKGLLLDRAKRRAVLGWFLFQILGATAVMILLWIFLALDKSPISASHLVVAVMMAVVPWFLYHHFKNTMLFFDDRIALAPNWMLHWKEFGATVEIVKTGNPDAPSLIQVLRYTATCSVCGAMVKLGSGQPDYPRRLVGRCEESPREHVFSFDRVTKSGATLTRPPVTMHRAK